MARRVKAAEVVAPLPFLRPEPATPLAFSFPTAGMDEAGRGPAMGPLVVAGVAVLDPRLPKKLGCTDSKKLLPDRRRALDRALRARLAEGKVAIEVRSISAEELDAQRRQGRTLTDIEVEAFQSIGTALNAALLHVDAAHVDADAFARLLRPRLPVGTDLVSEHQADVSYPVVGAASIVAKVARDAAIEALARRLERKVNLPLGSGYPSDPLTQAFLKAWWAKFGTWPEGTRTTWATIKDIMAPQPVPLDRFLEVGAGDATL